MTNLVYSIKVNELYYSGLKVLDVKIGKTANIDSTLAQYKRSSRDIKILDLWAPNENLQLSECEKGVHQLAERYAYERRSEKFIFLQDDYDKFSKNVSLLLEKVSKYPTNEVKDVEKPTYVSKSWDISELKRDNIKGSPDDLVAIFPTREEGIEFLKKYSAWGYVKMNKKPKYLAFYIAKPYSQILFVGEFSYMSEPFNNKDDIKNIDDADKDTFSPGKSIVYLKKGSLVKLSNPISCEQDGYAPQGLFYTTLEKIKKAKNTDELRKFKPVLQG